MRGISRNKKGELQWEIDPEKRILFVPAKELADFLDKSSSSSIHKMLVSILEQDPVLTLTKDKILFSIMKNGGLN